MCKAVELLSVTKQIQQKTIIDDISLTINKGEIFGLLGPNGAGKTTLIRMIVGLISITSGDIRINQKSITKNFKDAITNVGALVESPALYPELSGYDNLKLFARMNNNTDKNHINELIETLGLKEFIKKKVITYSLGMKQRLGIAIALLNKPSVLILDEPTNGLDPQGILDLRNYLKDLTTEKNISVIVSSHMLSEMNLLCNRFAVINKGQLLSVTNDTSFSSDLEIEYELSVDNSKQALTLLEDNYQAYTAQDKLMIKINKKAVTKVLSKLIDSNIKVYAVIPTENSLERYYFDVLEEKDLKS